MCFLSISWNFLSIVTTIGLFFGFRGSRPLIPILNIFQTIDICFFFFIQIWDPILVLILFFYFQVKLAYIFNFDSNIQNIEMDYIFLFTLEL